MIYTRTDIGVFEAFALTEEAWRNPNTCPKWLADFISDGNIFSKESALAMKMFPGIPGTCCTLNFGDMIVRDVDKGYFYTCTVKDFNNTYAPVVNPEYFVILKALNDAQKEYITFLGKSIGDSAVFLASHNQGASQETCAEGARLRGTISELEAKLYN
jgi:hypothetical protein